MRYGQSNNYPGQGLMDAYEQGFDRRLQGLKHDSDMETGALDRLLRSQEGQRKEQMHPLEMEGKGLTNTGLGITNQFNQQKSDAFPDEERRKQEKHQWEQAEEMAKSYGAVASEIEALPEGMRIEYLNKRYGDSDQGRNLIRGLQQGIVAGKTTLKDLPEGFRTMSKKIIESSAAYKQAMDTAGVRADQAETTARIRAESQTEVANIRGQLGVAAAAQRGADAVRAAEVRAQLVRERDAEKAKHEMNKLERQAELKAQYAKESGKGKNANPKTLEALSVKLEIEASELPADSPKKAELLQAADDAMERAITLRAAGKQQSDSTVITKPDGGVGIGQTSRTPAIPPRGGNKAEELPRPATLEEARKLPSGTRFMSPDGKIRVVP